MSLNEMLPWFKKYNSLSYTKINTYNSCPRRYYYANIGYAKNNEQAKDIRKLKALMSIYMLEGKLLHDIFNECFTTEDYDVNYLKRKTNEIFINRLTSIQKNKIIEFYNIPIDQEDYLFSLSNIMSHASDTLDNWLKCALPCYKNLTVLDKESFKNLYLNDIQAVVKLDLLTLGKNNFITITDWKTGKYNEKFNYNVQSSLNTYYVYDKYQIPLEKIAVEYVYLNPFRIKIEQYNLDTLHENILDFIKTSENFNSTDMGDYQASAHKNKCISCNFYTICDEAIK